MTPEAQAADLAEAEKLVGHKFGCSLGEPGCVSTCRVAAIAAALEKAREQGDREGSKRALEAVATSCRTVNCEVRAGVLAMTEEALAILRGSDAAR